MSIHLLSHTHTQSSFLISGFLAAGGAPSPIGGVSPGLGNDAYTPGVPGCEEPLAVLETAGGIAYAEVKFGVPGFGVGGNTALFVTPPGVGRYGDELACCWCMNGDPAGVVLPIYGEPET